MWGRGVTAYAMVMGCKRSREGCCFRGGLRGKAVLECAVDGEEWVGDGRQCKTSVVYKNYCNATRACLLKNECSG